MQIQRDPELRGVDYVLFDEYHERSWQADTTLAFALESQAQWRSEEQPLHLLIMSATLPAEALADWWHFFGFLNVDRLREEVALAKIEADRNLTDVTQRRLSALRQALLRVESGEPDDPGLAEAS